MISKRDWQRQRSDNHFYRSGLCCVLKVLVESQNSQSIGQTCRQMASDFCDFSYVQCVPSLTETCDGSH